MTRYEYRERIKQLKKENKLLSELVRMYKASEYIDGMVLAAYRKATFDALALLPPCRQKINIMTECTNKIEYANQQYEEHFPVKKE